MLVAIPLDSLIVAAKDEEVNNDHYSPIKKGEHVETLGPLVAPSLSSGNCH